MDDDALERLLGLPEIIAFHYDEIDWSVCKINDGLFVSKFREYCVSRIERMRGFLEMPYIEDIFGGDDKGRYVWMNKMSKAGFIYDDVRDVNIFRIGRLNGMLLGEGFVSRNVVGCNVDELDRYVDACEFLMPFREEQGVVCKVNRGKYDAMGFEEKRLYVYEIKENVFGFLNCLANEGGCRRKNNLD